MKKRFLSLILVFVLCSQFLIGNAGAISVLSGSTTDPIIASWERWDAVNGYNYRVTKAVDNTYYTWDRYNDLETWRHDYTYRNATSTTRYDYDVDKLTFKLTSGSESSTHYREAGSIWVAKSLSGPWTSISWSQVGVSPYVSSTYPYVSSINPTAQSQDDLARYYGDDSYRKYEYCTNWSVWSSGEIAGTFHYWEVGTSDTSNYTSGSTTDSSEILFYYGTGSTSFRVYDVDSYGEWETVGTYRVKVDRGTTYIDPGSGKQYSYSVTDNTSSGYSNGAIAYLNSGYRVILSRTDTFIKREQGSANGTVTSMDINAHPTGNTYDSSTDKWYNRRPGTTIKTEDSEVWIRNECLSASTTTGLHSDTKEWYTFVNQGWASGNIHYGTVTSTSSSAYPENGKSGSYWYIKNTPDSDSPTLNITQKRSSSGLSLYITSEDPTSDSYIYANGVAYETPLTLFSDSIESVSLYAQDVWGNRSAVQNIQIDAVGPSIYVEYNPKKDGNMADAVDATITVTDTSGLDAKPIKIGNGDWVENNATYHFSSNGSVLVYAKDSLGNISSFTMSVDWIDLEIPVVTGLVPDVEGFTSGNVRLEAHAKDDTGLDAKPYLWGTYAKNTPDSINWVGDWSSSQTMTVEENIGVALKVRDLAGKESEIYKTYVENIDRTAPIIDDYKTNVPLTSSISAEDGVQITINAHDPVDAITSTSAGLVNDYVFWNGAWGGRTNTFYSPGTLTIKVRDAAGNVSSPITITIPEVDSEGPVITSFTGNHIGKEWTTAPVTLTATAVDGDGSNLPTQCFSWDGGKSWTSMNTKTVEENGEYILTVRDKVGNKVTDSILVTNIDSEKPSANVYLAKTRKDPSDATSELVWKVYVDVSDQISGVDYVKTLWDGGTHVDTFPIVQEVTSTGMYGVIVVDKAGNESYSYLTVTNEMIGKSSGSSYGSDVYIDTVLNTSIDGVAAEWCDPSNLVYGPQGMYNKSTGNYVLYSSIDALGGKNGVFLQLKLTSRENTWTTGVAKLNGVNYPITFDGFGGSTEIAKAPTVGYVFVPISGITQDVKNGRLKILLNEWRDETKTENLRSGSLQVYVSVQKTPPIVSYNYNKATGKLTLTPSSTVAGIDYVSYSTDGATPSIAYSMPFTVTNGSTIKVKAVDRVQQQVDLVLSADGLALNGSSGGMSSETISNVYSVSSYTTSTRTMDSYLINGNKSNTDQLPSSSVISLFE